MCNDRGGLIVTFWQLWNACNRYIQKLWSESHIGMDHVSWIYILYFAFFLILMHQTLDLVMNHHFQFSYNIYRIELNWIGVTHYTHIYIYICTLFTHSSHTSSSYCMHALFNLSIYISILFSSFHLFACVHFSYQMVCVCVCVNKHRYGDFREVGKLEKG